MLLNSLKLKEKELVKISDENVALVQEIAEVKAGSKVINQQRLHVNI